MMTHVLSFDSSIFVVHLYCRQTDEAKQNPLSIILTLSLSVLLRFVYFWLFLFALTLSLENWFLFLTLSIFSKLLSWYSFKEHERWFYGFPRWSTVSFPRWMSDDSPTVLCVFVTLFVTLSMQFDVFYIIIPICFCIPSHLFCLLTFFYWMSCPQCDLNEYVRSRSLTLSAMWSLCWSVRWKCFCNLPYVTYDVCGPRSLLSFWFNIILKYCTAIIFVILLRPLLAGFWLLPDVWCLFTNENAQIAGTNEKSQKTW